MARPPGGSVRHAIAALWGMRRLLWSWRGGSPLWNLLMSARRTGRLTASAAERGGAPAVRVQALPIATADHQVVSVHPGGPEASGALFALVPRRKRGAAATTVLRTVEYRPAGRGLGTTLLARLENPGAPITPAELGLDHLVVDRGDARYLLRAGDRLSAAM